MGGVTYSIPVIPMPHRISCIRFSKTEYLVGTVYGEIAVVDFHTLEQWHFNVGVSLDLVLE